MHPDPRAAQALPPGRIGRRALLAGGVALSAAPVIAQALRTVRFIIPSFGMTMIPTLTASALGMDRAAGMEFTFGQAPGSIGIRAMIAGEYDFSLSAGAAVTAAVQGAPVRVIAVHIAKSFYYMYGRAGVRGLDDLAGRTIGIGAVGDSTDIAARNAIRAAGGDPTRATYVAMGIDNVPQALIAGSIEAGVITPPRDLIVEKAGGFRQLGFLGDHLPTPTSGVATTRQVIEREPDLVRQVLRVVMRGQAAFTGDRATGEAMLARWLRMDAADSAIAWERAVPHFNAQGGLSDDVQATIIESQRGAIRVRQQREVNPVFDLRFLPAA